MRRIWSRRRFLAVAAAGVPGIALAGPAAGRVDPIAEKPALRRRVVLGRDAWGASPIAGSTDRHTPVRLTVHHTGSPAGDAAAGPAAMRGHQLFHQRDRGWIDIAYHFVVGPSGIVYRARPVGYVGDTATDYDPAGHLLVACEGNFDSADLPSAQRLALSDVLAWAAAAFSIDPGTITGHGDWAATSCPGAALARVIHNGDLAAQVRRVIERDGVRLDVMTGARGREAVAALELDGRLPLARGTWQDRDGD
jgi:hypothetical protein